MRFRCCRCKPKPYGREFEADAPVCPSCGCADAFLVYPVEDVHLIVFHAQGAIDSMHGRQFVACQPNRDHLALGTDPGALFHATGDVRAVTCRSCKGTTAYREIAKLFSPDPRSGFRIDPAAGCCG